MNSDQNINKLKQLEIIFKTEINQTPLGDPNELCIALPLMNRSFKIIKDEILTLPYKIFAIHMLFFKDSPVHSMKWIEPSTGLSHNSNNNNFNKRQTNQTEQVFNVRADIQNDIYYLDNGSTEDELVAYIPNIAISVFMNSIFRKIKENDNLDLLEESEDEEEFENTSDERFVDLEKRVKMRCVFHKHFKRWVPLELIT